GCMATENSGVRQRSVASEFHLLLKSSCNCASTVVATAAAACASTVVWCERASVVDLVVRFSCWGGLHGVWDYTVALHCSSRGRALGLHLPPKWYVPGSQVSVTDVTTAEMHAGLAFQGRSKLKILISYVDNLPPWVRAIFPFTRKGTSHFFSTDSLNLALQVGEDVVAELTRAVVRQGLDMRVSALLLPCQKSSATTSGEISL
ncbi:hypothetical protein B296_00021550, partial [Ensete ventricosum]